jgi:mannan endo-1,4-beta-mannosidase
MKKPERFFCPSLLILAWLLIAAQSSSQFSHFVTRKADKLYDGDQQLRFISFNTPNLHYIEDYLPFEGINPWRLPDEFEIRDALTSIKQLGGKVTRMYVLSVRREDDAPGIIRHVEAPGRFNEEAFKALDMVLKIANEVGIRVIIPFVDNWRWWGGPKEYAAFRGEPKEAFWTNPEIIADVKATIKFLVTRKNTCTGITYRDDKAILAWETGNELTPPFSWTREIAAYVKSLDTNHLLAEGTHVLTLSQEALDDPHLDILTSHHYGNPRASVDFIMKNSALARGKKPYIVGEYGIIPLQDIYAITDTIINQGITGGMIWSLRFHNRDGGFYSHYEYNNVESYRWPGFSSGDNYQERLVLNFLRDRAYRIDGTTPPRLPIPAAPVLLDFKDPSRISWQGSTGAPRYAVARREADSPQWETLASLDDSRFQYRALFNDESVLSGKQYFYRVQAVNESGASEWSNIVGPVTTHARVLVDEMEDFGQVYQKDGLLRLLKSEDLRKAKEDQSRLTGTEGSYIMYKLPAATSSVRVEWFKTGPDADVALLTSPDQREFSSLPAQQQMFVFSSNDYGFFEAVASVAATIPDSARCMKIILRGRAQIGKVEIAYPAPLN